MNEHTLNEGEPHPSAYSAMQWLSSFATESPLLWAMAKETIYLSLKTGNRTAEILSSTLDRLENKQPVSDRYLLGLVWHIRDNWHM